MLLAIIKKTNFIRKIKLKINTAQHYPEICSNQQYFQIFRQSDKHFTFRSKNSLKTKAHKKAKKCKNSI